MRVIETLGFDKESVTFQVVLAIRLRHSWPRLWSSLVGLGSTHQRPPTVTFLTIKISFS